MSDRKTLTTADGMPVADNQNSLSVGPRGPLLAQDFHLAEKMAHFNRERIPERVVHAKGAGAFGTFTVTHDITRYTKAKVFGQIGKKTELLARFSTVGGEKGSADSDRDPRGFSLKFYTEQGNWDMVGNNTPIFFVHDPLEVLRLHHHTQKRDPRTNLKSSTAMWDFWSLSPESLHQVTILFSDRGTPGLVPAHERLWEPYLQLPERRGGAGLGQVSTSRRSPGDQELHPRRGRRGPRRPTPIRPPATLFESIESGDYPKWTLCSSRSCPRPTPRRPGTTRST